MRMRPMTQGPIGSAIGSNLIKLVVLLVCVTLNWRQLAYAQAVSSGGSRVFVTGFTPVIGRNGSVGGVDVDVDGVLKAIGPEQTGQLNAARDAAMKGIADDLSRQSSMRKVSLRGLQEEVKRAGKVRQPLGSDLLYLAGLQRIEYVFVYPEMHDVVIAGPAEGWEMVGDAAVGASTRQAVLRLDDLLDALHGNAAAVEGTDGISCSIDPSVEGMARVQRLLQNRNLRMSEAVLREMERQLGDQIVSVTGVRPSSHFARVLVSADYVMKRIAINLEPSGIRDLPSYLTLMQRGKLTEKVTAPRWWMATHYESATRTEDGLAFRFQGPGVKVMSEHGYMNARGELVDIGRPSPLAKQWADDFTRRFGELAKVRPIFGQLRGCVDLALLAALLRQEDLLERGECDLSFLADPARIMGEELAIPRRVPSLASAVRGRGGWLVSVSGGVDLDTWVTLDKIQINPEIAVERKRSIGDGRRWWWD